MLTFMAPSHVFMFAFVHSFKFWRNLNLVNQNYARFYYLKGGIGFYIHLHHKKGWGFDVTVLT